MSTTVTLEFPSVELTPPVEPEVIASSTPATREPGHGGPSSPGAGPSRVFATATPVMSRTARPLIITLLVVINTVQFVSVFTTIGGGLALSALLGRPVGAGQANWMAASYSLTQGAFVLVTGRLGSIYGYQTMFVLGSAWFALMSLANAFCTTYETFIAVRALTGIGGGMFMPNAVAAITTMIPPGRSRNLTLGFFGASPPIGGVLGALVAGVSIELVEWKWMYVLLAGVSAVLTGLLVWLLPKETPVDASGKIDYIGAFLGLGGLLLFNIAWNQAPAVGWHQPYEMAILVLSVVLFCAFLLWEKQYAKDPIMPLHIFSTPTFTALIFVVLLSYMAFGIAVWYNIAWQQILRGTTVIQTGVNFIPFGVGSVASVALAAWLIPRIAAQWILGLGVATALAADLLIATMPVQQTYWTQAFFSTLMSSFCPDFVYVAAQLIASNSVGRRHQGVAGSLVGTLNLYGNSLGLGFAGTIETELAKGHSPSQLAYGYRAACYFGAGLAVVGLVLDFLFVRMPKDERDGWGEESEEHVRPTAASTAIELQDMS